MVRYLGVIKVKNFLKDNLVIIIIVAVFLITVGLFGYIFVKKMTDSQKDIEDKVSFIEKKYQEFSTSSSVISEQRTKIYNEVFNNAYYVDFSSKDEEWKTYFNDYYDLIDKLFQWMLLPRMVMMAIILFMCVIMPFIYFTLAVKWWALFAIVLFIFAMATPNYLVDEKWDSTFFKIPFVLMSSVLRKFKLGRKITEAVNLKQ